jgi:hypothetical protein
MNRRLQYCTWKNLFIALLLIHVLPIWIFPYFPTQDGPAHVYNSKVLKDYHDTDNHEIREAYRLNLRLFPNWTSHASMTALMYVVPPRDDCGEDIPHRDRCCRCRYATCWAR